MNRSTRATPWLFVALAVVFIALSVSTTDLLDPWWRPIIVLGGLAAAVHSRLVARLPFLFVIALAMTSARLATGPIAAGNPAASELGWLEVLQDLAVGVALCAMLTAASVRRNGEMSRREMIDMLAIAIGASIVTWLLVTNPLINEHGQGAALSIAGTAYLPISVLILTFSIDLMYVGLTRNRTMQFVVAAAIANLVATVINCLRLVEVLPSDTRSVSVGAYVVAFLLLCAALVHPDGPQSLAVNEDPHDHRQVSKSRLTVMTLALSGPVAAIAVIAPTSTLDAVVRAVTTLALVVTLVVRLTTAMHDHARARTTLMQRVNRDDLTGLPTRTRFVEVVSHLLETTWRSELQPTIIQLNLDRFKNINDSLGHFDANRVLVVVADRLGLAISAFGGTAARSGGDDFVIVDGTTTSTADAMMRVEAIRHALSQPITVAESTIFVTASIGVAVTPRNRTLSAEELMRRADIATHRAKADGRNRVALFDDSMQAHLAQRMDVEHALHGAIGRQEMRLYHQPIVDIVTGRVSGFEALMRWQRSDGTLVSPADFIPVAEETGIICELGAWALHDALRELRGWIDTGVVAPTTTVSVNVSPRQIADPNFAEVVRDALDRSGVGSNLLWLEMTESMMLEEPELAQSTLRQIRSMGVRLALDDFGTGYSSLSLLQQFPIQRIKIDRAFVQGLGDHGTERSLVRTIIAMARSMGLDLVAEGVETVPQLESLRDMGCDKAQGFLISRPVPADAMRSTMVALDELQSLSLFRQIGAPPSPAMLSTGASPYRTGRPTASVGISVAGPIGNMGSRPLGQPLL
jgi:diguanylate cyclase (GGDEF)-like protein